MTPPIPNQARRKAFSFFIMSLALAFSKGVLLITDPLFLLLFNFFFLLTLTSPEVVEEEEEVDDDDDEPNPNPREAGLGLLEGPDSWAVAASKYQSLVPLYVFDHRILSRLQQVRATSIFAEEEVEYHLCKMIGIVDESLATVASIDGNLEIFQWRTPFYDIKNLNDLPASYNDFTKLQLSPTSPIVSPMLPRARIELNWGGMMIEL
ncbi:hypothetical protein Q3G72_003937 [Acer saccharum]|nr:hypothetical protein Q3G72_003937 [Acer saccharum]